MKYPFFHDKVFYGLCWISIAEQVHFTRRIKPKRITKTMGESFRSFSVSVIPSKMSSNI